jgi:transcriptional regulator
VDDAGWVRAQLLELTTQQESAFAQPWSVDDAPADHIDKMLAAIVGIEIPIQELTGKWKVSQNQPEVNQAGVVQGLGHSNDVHAPAMSGLVAANAKAAP